MQPRHCSRNIFGRRSKIGRGGSKINTAAAESRAEGQETRAAGSAYPRPARSSPAVAGNPNGIRAVVGNRCPRFESHTLAHFVAQFPTKFSQCAFRDRRQNFSKQSPRISLKHSAPQGPSSLCAVSVRLTSVSSVEPSSRPKPDPAHATGRRSPTPRACHPSRPPPPLPSPPPSALPLPQGVAKNN